MHDSEKTSEARRGMPHWHLLINETVGAVTERVLRHQWRVGLSHFRLVDKADTKTPYYVTKYLTKADTEVRIRASLNYGAASMLSTITDRTIRAVNSLGYVEERRREDATSETRKDA
jgi:hypothetical protein